MLKKTTVAIVLASLVLAPAFAQGTDGKGKQRKGYGGGIAELLETLPLQNIDAQEKTDLLFIREEEKLARDVYLTLYRHWMKPIFSNIALSEQRHMDAVKLLLDRYKIADPVKDNSVGAFTNPEFTRLFAELVAAGKVSFEAALRTGAGIEEKDIRDLQVFISRTDNLDLRTVYQNLMKGSRNHLRAFVWQLEALGVTYLAQILSPAELEAIVSKPIEQGLSDAKGGPVFGNTGW